MLRRILGLQVESLPQQYWDAVEALQPKYLAAFGHSVTALEAKSTKPQVMFQLAGLIESGSERRVLVHAETPETKAGAGDGNRVDVWVRTTSEPQDKTQPFDFQL